jgi:hypothetical protein
MKLPNKYSCLNKNEFSLDQFKIIPLRYEDRLEIMKWRNEQIYHLRQNKPLTLEDQENYFNVVISKLFEQEQPNQILFSFLEKGICVGYGGLVHINWIDKNAEVSFVIKTDVEEKYFETFWELYLNLIEQVSIEELNLHKLYVYAFDLRPNLYLTLENSNYFLDAKLNEHCFFNEKFIDVIIYSKLLKN